MQYLAKEKQKSGKIMQKNWHDNKIGIAEFIFPIS